MAPTRSGCKVICIHMPTNYGNRLTVGKEYIVESIDDNGEWLRVMGGNSDYEAKYFRVVDAASKSKLFRVTVDGGHVYRIRCTEEAIKELAEFIGDDNLIGIEPIVRMKKSA